MAAHAYRGLRGPVAVQGPWLGYAIDRAAWAARADAAAPGTAPRVQAAIAWVTDPRFAASDAPRVRAWLDGAAGGPEPALVSALLAAAEAGAPLPATALSAVGRHDRVLADEAAPVYLRAAAATQRRDAAQAVRLLRDAATARDLAPHEALLLAGQLHNLQRPDEALEVLDRLGDQAAAVDAPVAALLARLRADAMALVDEQRRIRQRIGNDGRLPFGR